MSKQRVLFCIHFNSYFYNLFGIAKYISSFHYEPVFMFATDYPNRHVDIQLCSDLGFKTINSHGALISLQEQYNQVKKKKKQSSGLFQLIPANLKRNISEFRRYFSKKRFWVKRLNEIELILKHEKISIIILGGDIAGTDTSAVIASGKKLNIPSAAFVNWLGKFEAASIYRANPEHQMNSLLNKLAAKLYPQWAHEIDGQVFLKLPGPELMAIESLGIAPEKPWILHSGNLDAIGVEGDVMRKAAIEMGLPQEKVFSTGTMQNDEMKKILDNAKQLRRELYQSLDLQHERPMILTALPPDLIYEVAGKPQCPDCDFQDYRQLLDFWMRNLTSNPEYQVVVSLHPSVDPNDFKFIEDYGARISRLRISELIPLSDIFVACISATINWAIAAGKPVINYDVYRYRYQDYVNAPGVITIEEQSQFISLLNKLTRDPDFYNEVLITQRNDSKRWAKLDGKTGERIMDLISSLVQKAH